MHIISPKHKRIVKHYQGARPIFTKYQLEKQIASIYENRVELKSGGSIVIEQAEALVAIDVNSGKSIRQESIERTGDISQATFNKIKDRYQRNLELSARHIRELIDRRLIRKKGPEAISAIKDAYRVLKNGFADLKVSEDEFIQI